MTLIKDPGSKLDYNVDWTQWLGTDTIAVSTWTVPAGLTNNSEGLSGGVATVWLSGGTVGQTYTVTNRITTNAGRIEERSFTITVIER